VLRVIWRNVLVFAHQFVVVLVVLALFAKLELRMLPLAALGMFLLLLQALWITPLLGLLGTRFRDLQPIITNSLQVLFFITPVIWAPALLGSQLDRRCEPLTSLMAVVRGLLGNVPTLANYAVVLAMTAAGFLLTMLMYGRFRTRVVYWL
jgi:ABC-type polysaccharide/polyol phosphate export permease